MEKYFSKKLLTSKGKLIYLLRAEDKDQEVWYYILFKNKAKHLMFESRVANDHGNINIRDYGEVLFSGWGRRPPERITSYLKTKYPT